MNWLEYVKSRENHYNTLIDSGKATFDICFNNLMIDLHYPLIQITDEPYDIEINLHNPGR